MFRLIIKNLWSRRKRNGWLLAELVIVTVLAWIILDPVIVKTYVAHCSPGYDAERLARISLFEISPMSSRYDAAAATPEARTEAITRIIGSIAGHPCVDKVVPVLRWATFESQGSSWEVVNPNDSVSLSVSRIDYVGGTPFFETFGLEGVAGGPSAAQLDGMTPGPGEIVISESLARALFPDGKALGHYMLENTHDFDEASAADNDRRIVGVVNDAVIRSSMGRSMITYTSSTLAGLVSNDAGNIELVVRIKPNVNMASFLNDFRPLINTELKSGNVKAYDIKSYESIKEDLGLSQGETNELRLKTALAVFFLVNLCLGVIGTFYLQTRKRSEDAGVMRSFGATPGYIMREMLGEVWVLATLAWLVGCLAYMQYALKEGLEIIGGFNGATLAAYMPDWTDSFMLHFTIVSLIIYVILIAVVSAGVYLPARRISRVTPADALPDE